MLVMSSRSSSSTDDGIPAHLSRRVLELRFLHGYSLKEVAAEMNFDSRGGKSHAAAGTSSRSQGAVWRMNRKPEDRVDRVISNLLNGRRLKLGSGDADERAAIIVAARLAGAFQGPKRMHSAFKKGLAQALDRAPTRGWVTRRAALMAGLGLAAGAATGGLFEMTRRPRALARAGGHPIDPINGRWIDVAALNELVEGEGKRVAAGAVGAYLFRRGDTVTAISSVCSHLPCELRWDGVNDLLACPCHPATFTRDGQSTDRTYPLPALNQVHVRVTVTGRVEVLGTAS
jgi:nitrite reductase/ring-hydroxylating ferredoxin subunit